MSFPERVTFRPSIVLLPSVAGMPVFQNFYFLLFPCIFVVVTAISKDNFLDMLRGGNTMVTGPIARKKTPEEKPSVDETVSFPTWPFFYAVYNCGVDFPSRPPRLSVCFLVRVHDRPAGSRV